MLEIIYKITAINKWQGNVSQVLLQPNAERFFTYQAGQYLEILHPQGFWAPLSIANAPRSDHSLELHIRHRANENEAEALLNALQQTSLARLRGPLGQATYNAKLTAPTLLLAGGTGIAPLKAILEQAALANDKRAWHLYWSSRISKEFYLPELFIHDQEKLQLVQTRLISQPEQELTWLGEVGYIQQILGQQYHDLSAYQVYASGPYGMVLAVYELCSQLNLAKEHFYSDML